MEKLLLANERKHTFTISGKVQGKDVTGEFECKYPSVIDELSIDSLASKLLEKSNPDTLRNDAFYNAHIIAYTNTLLTKRPDWYNLEVIDNIKIVEKVYKEVLKFVNTFRQRNEQTTDTPDSNDTEDKEVMEGK